MTRLDRLTLGLLIATVAFLALILVFARARQWLDGRYLRRRQTAIDRQTEPYRRALRRRQRSEP